ncbi:hypothetical protein D3C83_63240 [compost metagenome]
MYWSKSLSISSGSIISLSPCIATESDRTTASASSSGNPPFLRTSSCMYLMASTSSLIWYVIVAVSISFSRSLRPSSVSLRMPRGP